MSSPMGSIMQTRHFSLTVARNDFLVVPLVGVAHVIGGSSELLLPGHGWSRSDQ